MREIALCDPVIVQGNDSEKKKWKRRERKWEQIAPTDLFVYSWETDINRSHHSFDYLLLLIVFCESMCVEMLWTTFSTPVFHAVFSTNKHNVFVQIVIPLLSLVPDWRSLSVYQFAQWWMNGCEKRREDRELVCDSFTVIRPHQLAISSSSILEHSLISFPWPVTKSILF